MLVLWSGAGFLDFHFIRTFEGLSGQLTACLASDDDKVIAVDQAPRVCRRMMKMTGRSGPAAEPRSFEHGRIMLSPPLCGIQSVGDRRHMNAVE